MNGSPGTFDYAEPMALQSLLGVFHATDHTQILLLRRNKEVLQLQSLKDQLV